MKVERKRRIYQTKHKRDEYAKRCTVIHPNKRKLWMKVAENIELKCQEIRATLIMKHQDAVMFHSLTSAIYSMTNNGQSPPLNLRPIPQVTRVVLAELIADKEPQNTPEPIRRPNSQILQSIKMPRPRSPDRAERFSTSRKIVSWSHELTWRWDTGLLCLPSSPIHSINMHFISLV